MRVANLGPSAVLAGVLLGTVLSSCASSPGIDGATPTQVRAMPPAACRLAVGLTAAPTEAAANSDGLQFTMRGTELRDAVVAQLTALNSASAVFGVTNAAEAQQKQADLFLELSVSQTAPMAHKGMSSGWWSSGLLWVVTWIGGLLVDDSTYDTRVRLDAKFSRVTPGRPPQMADHKAESGPIDLNYWDRNTLLSWRFLQSLVLPPFWTSDDPAITSATLTDKAMQSACVQLSRFIKSDIEKGAFNELASFTLIQPDRNGASVPGDSTPLQFEIQAPEGNVRQITVQVNEGNPFEVSPPARVGGGVTNLWRIEPIPVAGLRPGRNELRVNALFGDERFTRTVVVWRGDANGSQ